MSDFEELPDAEALAVYILKNADFSPFTPHVDVRLPHDPDFDKGVIQVQRVGGIPAQRRRVDRANIQVDVWATTKADAHDIAQRARAILHRAEGKAYSDVGAVLTGTDDALGLSWAFDTLNLKPRYLFAVYLITHRYP